MPPVMLSRRGIVLSRIHPAPPLSIQGSFSITDIAFTEGASSQHDLSQYYASEIGAENVTNIELVAGSLPSGVSINVGNESLDYDGAGAVDLETGLQIRVTTDG